MSRAATTLLRLSLPVTIMTLVVAACSTETPAASPAPSPQPATATPTAPAADPTSTPTIASPTATSPAGDDETTFGTLAYIGSDGHVYVMRADGSNRVRISEPDPEGARAAHTWPMWSGDGGSVLFSRVVVDADGPQFSLQSATLGDTGPSLVYENPPGARFVGRNAPHYTNGSPDGQHVAFLAVAGNMALLLGDVAGGAQARSYRPRIAALLRLDARLGASAAPPAGQSAAL